ncbi:MAG: hypothetical protein ABIZ80_03805 [Bryobacteraceae bacterium]
MGKITILRKLHGVSGGALVEVRQILGGLRVRPPAAIEEAFLETLEDALACHEFVIVDDLHLITNVVNSCDYPRTHLLDAALTAILGQASARQQKLLFAVDDGEAPWPVERRAYAWKIGEFTPVDYECICRVRLEPPTAELLDYTRIHRFAPMLSAYQLSNACGWLRVDNRLDTERFIAYFAAQNISSKRRYRGSAAGRLLRPEGSR